MPNISESLRAQIEAAFNYRGHVTIAFSNGEGIEGFLFNRRYPDPKTDSEGFIEIFPKGLDERRRYPMGKLQSIALTGEDAAKG